MQRPRLFLAAAVGAIALPVWFFGSSSAGVQRDTNGDAKAKVAHHLEGSWQLLSFALRSTDGSLSYPFGKDAVGKLTYTRDGNQWATVARRGLSKNLPDALWYTGSFDINLKRRTIVHHVKYSSVSAWEGTDLVRGFKLRDGRLTLTIAPSSPGGQTGVLKWKRLGAAARF
jgi:outer membrane phospholipase A